MHEGADEVNTYIRAIWVLSLALFGGITRGIAIYATVRFFIAPSWALVLMAVALYFASEFMGKLAKSGVAVLKAEVEPAKTEDSSLSDFQKAVGKHCPPHSWAYNEQGTEMHCTVCPAVPTVT